MKKNLMTAIFVVGLIISCVGCGNNRKENLVSKEIIHENIIVNKSKQPEIGEKDIVKEKSDAFEKSEEEAPVMEEAVFGVEPVEPDGVIENPPDYPPMDEETVRHIYIPEQAIAVYCTIMEASDITWNPSLKELPSWRTGWIYLEKGNPERCASADLDSFVMGDVDGNPWTEYYIEVMDSNENAVFVTVWHN